MVREKILFDDGWMFHKGDIEEHRPKDKGPMYARAKTMRKISGPASMYYKALPNCFYTDRDVVTDLWEWVTLPHDYVIEETPMRTENNTLGYVKYENAWYRKSFTVGEDDRGKRLIIYFDGVATHATVYLNGCLMKHNFSGYTSFEVDISDVVKFGEENVLAVYVSTEENEGWWYEGGGIYRHVWLIKTDSVAVDLYGVYVKPTLEENGTWRVGIETTIVNDSYTDERVELVTQILDANGSTVGIAVAEICVALRERACAKYETTVIGPRLWDIDDPYRHTARTTVKVGGVIRDVYETKFGFRHFELDPNKGLFLNGRHIKIKGVCAHQDCGLIGKAVPDNIHRYKIEMIKEMGGNGYRTSHYPHSAETMDALDELGFIVMDEVRWFESTDEGKAQAEMLIKRDRNRPSVLFWSLGNEEAHHVTDEGRRICKSLTALAHKLDDTRYVMTAISVSPEIATVNEELDAIGINYNLDKYDGIHKAFPNKAVFSSECCATGTTRGWYEDDSPERGYLNAFDKDTDNWFLGREKTWKFITEREWVLGEYQWTAFEHRGETVWPRLCSQSGAIDLYLQKKDAFYQNQCHWIEDRPLIHLCPHWNFVGREGEPIKVRIYTNCEAVELKLNGRSIANREVEKYGHADFEVPFEAGLIEAIGYNGGKAVCRDSHKTSGQAQKLMMRLDNTVSPNGRDVAIVTCYCVDAEGTEVPTAAPFVHFNTNKLGSVIATGSDICDHIPPNVPCRKMRAGRISVAVRVGSATGDLKVTATADGLADAVLTIPLK